ncbi:UTP--hexose-1-phosphate uridylyltransferase [Ostertagia ostertagi]
MKREAKAKQPKMKQLKRLVSGFQEEQVALADILQRLIIKYDNIFQCPFPFSMGWLGAPTGPLLNNDNQCWYLHASSIRRFSDQVTKVVKVWIEQFRELKDKYHWIQIFENRGAAVGCSNAHPHGQLWAGNFLPNYPSRKDKCQREYYSRHGRPLLFDVLQREQRDASERIVLQNQHWTVLVPYWAVWPYETMLLPNRHVLRLDELSEEEQVALADILQRLIIKYDNIFQCPFPFSMGWLGAPTGPLLNNDNQCWYLHASSIRRFSDQVFYTRFPTVPKYIAGYEMFSEPQRDITPEAAAATIPSTA